LLLATAIEVVQHEPLMVPATRSPGFSFPVLLHGSTVTTKVLARWAADAAGIAMPVAANMTAALSAARHRWDMQTS